MSNEFIPYSELAQALKLGEYKHFKGGLYIVVGVAKHSEDPAQEFVIYKSSKTGQTWIRPLNMFVEEIDREGYKGPRFKYIG